MIMNNFKYKIDNIGNVIEYGYYIGDTILDGSEPFTGFDIANYQKDIITGEWRLRDALLYKYFLIPLDLVPNIAHYAGFVYQTFPELIFDVVLQSQTITVEGTDVSVPSNQVKLIPCCCTHWTDEGLMLLDAVIENWNTSVPNKTINFQYSFESFDLFKAFRDEQIQVS